MGGGGSLNEIKWRTSNLNPIYSRRAPGAWRLPGAAAAGRGSYPAPSILLLSTQSSPSPITARGLRGGGELALFSDLFCHRATSPPPPINPSCCPIASLPHHYGTLGGGIGELGLSASSISSLILHCIFVFFPPPEADKPFFIMVLVRDTYFEVMGLSNCLMSEIFGFSQFLFFYYAT